MPNLILTIHCLSRSVFEKCSVYVLNDIKSTLLEHASAQAMDCENQQHQIRKSRSLTEIRNIKYETVGLRGLTNSNRLSNPP